MATKEEIIRELVRTNYWWELGRVEEKDALPYRREVFKELKKALKSRLITAIIGARRTGKTTLMYQLISSLIAEGVEPKRLVMFTFDNPIMLADEEIIPKIIETYREIAQDKEKVYFFLDEIQYVNHWSHWLKGYYDRKENIKFVVSGSSGTLIYKHTAESLAGRISFYRTYPFTFREFCTYHNRKLGSLLVNLRTENLKINHLFSPENIAKLEHHKSEILYLFNRYILYGGIPEVFGWSLRDAQKWIKSDYLGLVFYRDLLKTFEVRDIRSLEELFFFLTKVHSQRINYSTLANMLSTRIETVKKYLYYLEAIKIIHILNMYSRSIKKSIRAEKKVYIADPGIINSVLGNGEEILSDEEKVSKLVEGIIASHLINMYSEEFSKNLYFWRSVQEVDLVLSLGRELIPVEVKYRTRVGARDIGGLLKFMKKYNLERGVVVTRDNLAEEEINGRRIDFIPAWLFLATL